MKTLLGLFLLTGVAYAQEPLKPVRRDSLPSVDSPGVDSPGFILPGLNSPDRVSSDESTTDLMPNARPNNSFYRYRTDSRQITRATTDHMSVKVPDSSMQYTMLQVSPKRARPKSPTPHFLRPMPPVLPKKFPR
ncbi:hypothetical protein [Spirosoma koreense]